jgi:GT2 family glycosyltransferase
MEDSVSIIIVIYNRLEYLKALLESIGRLDLGGIKLETVIVDNFSSQPLRDFAERAAGENRRQIVYKRLNRHYLPAAAKNIGAREAKGNYLWFLDSDTTVIFPDTLKGMLSIAKNSPLIKIMGGEYLKYKDRLYFNDPQFHANLLFHGRFVPIEEFESKDMYCIASSNLFAGRDVFWELGGFNEGFSLFEDNDFCIRAGKRKYQLFSSKNICVLHHLAPTGRGKMDDSYSSVLKYVINFHRNRIKLLYCNYRRRLFVLPLLDFFLGFLSFFLEIKNRVKITCVLSAKMSREVNLFVYSACHVYGIIYNYFYLLKIIFHGRGAAGS